MEALFELLKPLEGYAPLLSALLTLVLTWRFLDQKAAVQLSLREARIREYLTGEISELKKELKACKESRDQALSLITELRTQIRELQWDRDHQRREL